jgi:hypothetical protein
MRPAAAWTTLGLQCRFFVLQLPYAKITFSFPLARAENFRMHADL